MSKGHRKVLRDSPNLLAEVEALAVADHPLDAIRTFVRRFVFLSEHQARVAAVWVVHTHVFESAYATPYLAITSAEKRSGKSTLLDVLELLVAEPWLTGGVSKAVLVRKINSKAPTLLLDESDAAFAGDKEYAEALRGVLNTGYKPSGKYSCCDGPNMEPKDFRTYSPKAIAGIGKLPDTVADRAIYFRLKRAAKSEYERFRVRDVEPEAALLKSEIEKWAAAILPGLRDARPDLPEELNGRQQDVSEPLLAIADCAGGEWSAALRIALVALCREAQADDSSIGMMLLTDIRNVFNVGQVERISSVDLTASLCEVETSPWAEWSKGKPLSAGKLARLLHPFAVSPAVIRVGEKTTRGYLREDFEDAWARYLPPVPQEGVKSVTVSQAFVINEKEKPQSVTQDSIASGSVQKAASNGPCNTVTFLEALGGTEERLEEGEI